MRILHTSDWHLGQHFMGRTREAEHRAFLHWLTGQILERKADVLVVAGDVFDTGTPPSYARTLYNEFIVDLQDTGCKALILGGNHDAAATLNEGRSLLACLNTQVVAGLFENIQDHVLVFNNRQGQPGLVVLALPFMRPRDLVKSMGGQSGQDKQQAVGEAIAKVYDQVARAADKRILEIQGDGNGRNLPVMATGHLTVVGGRASESVRDIYIGSLDAFGADGFPRADYIALGHLHRGQRIKTHDHIRYAGSPIPLSFDEGQAEKQILQVDFQDGALKAVEAIPVPCFRTLTTVKGDLHTIETGIQQFKNRPGTAMLTPAWLEVELADEHYLTDLQERIQAMIDTRSGDSPDLELLRVRRRRKTTSLALASDTMQRLEELTPKEVFARRLAKEEMTADQETAMTGLFDQILAQVREPEDDPDVTDHPIQRRAGEETL